MMHRFRIDAMPDPQSLLRVTGLFAQRSIVPAAMTMDARHGGMRIEVMVAGLASSQAAVLAAKLREVVAVNGAELDELAA